jgi:hypothetical protein
MSMRNRLFAVVAAWALLSGCYTAEGRLPGTVRPNLAATDYTKIKSFSVEVTNYFFVYGLAGAPEPSLFADTIQKEVKAAGGDGVVNLVIAGEETFGDVCISIIACGGLIVSPRTFTISGDIVKFNVAPL